MELLIRVVGGMAVLLILFVVSVWQTRNDQPRF